MLLLISDGSILRENNVFSKSKNIFNFFGESWRRLVGVVGETVGVVGDVGLVGGWTA